MRGAVTVIQAMLIMIISISLVALSIPWVVGKVYESMDISEAGSIKPQFESCNDMIIETARTGSTNRCVFTLSRGKLTGTEEGINYEIVSSANLCDKSDWVQIDERKHIWQRCNISGDKRIFEMKWKFPSELEIQGEIVGNQVILDKSIADIKFNTTVGFETITLYIMFEYNEGETGNVVEISRMSITPDLITLRIKIS